MDDPAWIDAERELGTVLPRDYKQLVALYGAGVFQDFLWLLSPFSTNEELNLASRSRRRADEDREFRDAAPEEFPFKIHPEPHGLLLCAETDTGSPIYWITKGPVDRWPLLIQAPRNPTKALTFECTLSELLLQLFAGRLHIPFFPRYHESCPFTFVPAGR